jgi:thymidine phosphorylase
MKTRERSRALAESIVKVGTANGLKVSALITAMNSPLGGYVGNALEVIESIETLKGKGPPDLTELSVKLAARMVELAGIATGADAEAKVRAALASGAGLEVFRKCIEQQGGDPKVIDNYSRLPDSHRTEVVKADRSGYITSMDAEKVGGAVRELGGGRGRAEDTIDHAVGVVVLAKPGAAVNTGDPVYVLRYRTFATRDAARPVLNRSFTVGDAPPAAEPLILEEIA